MSNTHGADRRVLRWAGIGTGTISRSVLPDLTAVEGSEVHLVHSRSAEKARAFAEEFGIPRHSENLDAVLRDPDIDAVYIATPHAAHFPQAKAALEAGKHVLVEKPMALNSAQVGELFALAEERGLFLMEAMWMKFGSAFTELMRRVEAGVIGDVTNVRASFSVPQPEGTGSRFDLARSGGALLDQGIYPVTLMHALLGTPDEVLARGSVRDDGLDLASHFSLEYNDGRYAQGASALDGFSELTASVAGTQGWLTLTAPFWANASLEVHAGSMKAIFVEPEVQRFEWEGNGYVPMARAVVEAIGAGLMQHPLHTAEHTLAVFGTLDTILAQIRSAGARRGTSGRGEGK